MSNSVAEAYLLILRPSMIPVVGEAVPKPFNLQIELDEWHWELTYDERADRGRGRTPSSGRTNPSGAATPFKGDELIRKVNLVLANRNLTQDARDRQVRDLVAKAATAQKQVEAEAGAGASEEGSDSGEAGEENKLKFTFKKNVDLASTQLLNSMKAGDVMPRAVLTLFHRAVNNPVTLIVTFGNVVLTKYDLKVEVSETMSDMKEEWEATFKTVDYVYQNRPAASGPNFVTQGTARVFKMKLKDLF